MHHASNLKELAPFKNENIHHSRHTIVAFQACTFLGIFWGNFRNIERQSIFRDAFLNKCVLRERYMTHTQVQ